MVELVLFLLALILLGIIVYRRGANPINASNSLAVWFVRCAFGLIILYIAFYLFFAVSELFSGDLTGLGHLIPAIMATGIAILANKRPLEGGIILIGLSVLLSISLLYPFRGAYAMISSAVLIISLPLLTAGALYTTAALFELQSHDQIRKDSSLNGK